MPCEVAAGTVVLGTPADRLGEPMSPVMAASRVDEWFPHHDPHVLPKLHELVRAAGGMVLRDDGDELRELIKRALHDGKLVAFTRGQSLVASTIRRPPEPLPRPYSPQPPVQEKESLRFRLRMGGTFEPIAHATVLIEYEDGKRERKRTNADGEIFFSAKTRTKFALIEIDEPFLVARIEETRE